VESHNKEPYLDKPLESCNKEACQGKPVAFLMDTENNFQPLAHCKLVDIWQDYQDYQPTEAQKYVMSTLMQSKDANVAAHDIWTGKYIIRCQKEDLMADVYIYIDQVPFPVHRIMLAKYSTFFQKLFCTSEYNHKKLPYRLGIKGISGVAFSSFLELIYDGDCQIMPATVKDLTIIAKEYGVNKLHSKINEYFLSMPFHNALEILQISSVSCVDHIYMPALTSVIRDFKESAKHPNFVKLPLDTVLQILSSNDLSVENETEVFNAAKVWIQHDPIKREHYLPHVMECVRFALMEYHEFSHIIKDTSNGILQKNEYFKEMLIKASW
jgi:hypothetical protein